MAGMIIVADDHPLFRDAMRQAISNLEGGYDTALAGSYSEVETLLSAEQQPELILLDLNMPGNNGFSGLMRLRSEHSTVPVVVISASEDDTTIRRSLELGAAGFIAKSASGEDIRRSILRVIEGEVCHPNGFDMTGAEDTEFSDLVEKLQTLTPQQSKVLSMLGEGLLNKQIAYELNVSEATVKAHVSAVLMKLGVDSRTQAVIALSKLGSGGAIDTPAA